MTLELDIESIIEVLLADAKWHSVEPGTFEIGTYELVRWGARDRLSERPEQTAKDAVSDIGFTFMEGNTRLAGPITQLLGIKLRDSEATQTE